ncbi:unnamed protein product [Vicia faba]|uniref:Uncharacterized protein n=1 Tax=Vicia faba TaxID=3906 RepID=A0AAV0Z665_VICFA|nr:unnamed protein product [Vicia faba]
MRDGRLCPIPIFFLAIFDCKTLALVLSISSSSHNLVFVRLQQDQTFVFEFIMNISPNALNMPAIHAMISRNLLLPFIFYRFSSRKAEKEINKIRKFGVSYLPKELFGAYSTIVVTTRNSECVNVDVLNCDAKMRISFALRTVKVTEERCIFLIRNIDD